MNTATITSRIPGWIGFLLLIMVGTAMTLNGIANHGLDRTNHLGFIVFGLCAVLIGAISWLIGANSEVKGRTGKVGVDVAVQDMPWWVWAVDIGVLALGIVIFVAAR